MVRLLLDEHVSRVFERLLDERGFDVEQAKDRFGEHTTDAALLDWCAENGAIIITNNCQDFRLLHERHRHCGIFLYRRQTLPDQDPEGLARTVETVISQYGTDHVSDELVDLDEWYAWSHD